MILSMTGFGKASGKVLGRNCQVMVKALNSKQIDISTKLPVLLREKEIELRNKISERVLRGKVELVVSFDEALGDSASYAQIDEVAVSHYLRECRRASSELYTLQPLSWAELLRLPGVLVSEDRSATPLDEEDLNPLYSLLDEALDELYSFRNQEGDMLEAVLVRNINEIARLLVQIERPEAERLALLRQRLEESLERVEVDYDRSRLEQELIYYIEKLDINEEKSRLENHLDYFLSQLSSKEDSKGKTLGFIAQEIGREINTLGSKSNNAEMQQIVVKMKDALEQIKEQVLNVL